MNVSICCITYNHVHFITQAIESFLEQKANFKIEIIISDDCSIDGSIDVLKKLKTLHRDRISLLANEKNIGILPNFLKALNSCKGKYIALCEGDDYWCDENKLQRQIDFLETNPDYAICFHKVFKLNEIKVLEASHLNTSDEEITYTIQDLAKQNFIHTPSVVFRNNLFDEFPAWFDESPAGDYVLHMLNAQHGLIKYFPQPMAVYRKHGGATWSTLGQQKGYEKWVQVLTLLLQENFEPTVKEELILQRRSYAEQLLQMLMNEKQWPEFLEKLSIYVGQDDYIAKQWALKYYPKYISKISAGRSYRLVNYLRKAMRAIS